MDRQRIVDFMDDTTASLARESDRHTNLILIETSCLDEIKDGLFRQ